MNSLTFFDDAASAERDRCAAIAARYVKMFEQKRLYNTARAMREVESAILEEEPESANSQQSGAVP